MTFSIIIPCFNNEAQLEGTVGRIVLALASETDGFEIILIDDASKDSTWEMITELSRNAVPGLPVLGIRLGSNIGPYHAILVGMEAAKGDAMVVMAADGDDPPELIPTLVVAFQGNVEAVLANRRQTEKGPASKLTGTVFRVLLKLSGARNIPSGGSDFLLFSRAVWQRTHAEGWMAGNTLIQLAQHASEVAVIDYTKGHSRPSSWSLGKKLRLFAQTVGQFVPGRVLRSKAPKGTPVATCGDVNIF